MTDEYDEPEELGAIRARRPSRRPGGGRRPPDFEERLEGAWAGRALGARPGRAWEDQDPRPILLKIAGGSGIRDAWREAGFPDAASLRDPQPEGPGAALRCEGYGLLHPGDPESAAAAAHADAALTHGGSGLYAAMMAAACGSWALVSKDGFEILEAGLSQVPQGSRFVRTVRFAVGLAGLRLDDAEVRAQLERYLSPFPRLHACRLMADTAAEFLRTGDDFARAARGGVLAAAWAGARLGLRAIPLAMRRAPEGVLKTGIPSEPEVRLSDMVRRNLVLIRT